MESSCFLMKLECGHSTHREKSLGPPSSVSVGTSFISSYLRQKRDITRSQMLVKSLGPPTGASLGITGYVLRL